MTEPLMTEPGRRGLLALLSALCLRPGVAVGADGGAYRLMVAGPPGGRLDHWADLLSPPVSRGMMSAVTVDRENVGGLDGVTGANQFEARGEPDGRVALLVPGTAALSWLVGESRAHFDPARWVPLWAGTNTAALVSRVALSPGSRLHVAASGPVGAELPFLLALDLMGIDAVLSPTPTADAIVLQGPGFEHHLAAAANAGSLPVMGPVMTLGVMGTSGRLERDPRLPMVPTAHESVQGKAPREMTEAVQAASIAVQLEAGLVLPALTPAAAVSLWRRACLVVQQNTELLGEASRLGTRITSADAVAACTSGVAGKASTVLALRRWLATRYEWRPA